MVKVIGKEDSLNEIFKAAEINSDFIEATYGEGIVIIQPKHLQCIQCGCNNESKLIKAEFLCAPIVSMNCKIL